MKRFDLTYGRAGKVLAELSIYEDAGFSRLTEYGFIAEMTDATDDLLASLRVIYGEVELMHSRVVEERVFVDDK